MNENIKRIYVNLLTRKLRRMVTVTPVMIKLWQGDIIRWHAMTPKPELNIGVIRRRK
jgi:hypothetical protein